MSRYPTSAHRPVSIVVCGLFLLSAGGAVLSCGPPGDGQPSAEKQHDVQQRDEQTTRPAHWATPVPDQPGLANLFMVDEGFYRSAQPEDAGFDSLRKLGVRTVINLRSLHSDRKECERAGLGYEHITVQAWEGEDDEVIDFLRVVTDPARRPVLVHCQHGADRTGTMVAVYRMVVQGWSKEEAIREMTGGGYGFHSLWQNLITYLEQLDVQRIREQAGIAVPAPAEASADGAGSADSSNSGDSGNDGDNGQAG